MFAEQASAKPITVLTLRLRSRPGGCRCLDLPHPGRSRRGMSMDAGWQLLGRGVTAELSCPPSSIHQHHQSPPSLSLSLSPAVNGNKPDTTTNAFRHLQQHSRPQPAHPVYPARVHLRALANLNIISRSHQHSPRCVPLRRPLVMPWRLCSLVCQNRYRSHVMASGADGREPHRR